MFFIALGCSLFVVLIWLGYPVLVALVARLVPGRAIRPVETRRTLSVIIATRDEPAMVERRVANILDSAWPQELLEVVVGLDATGAVEPEHLQFADARVRAVKGGAPGGKASALNAAVEASRGELLVFTDSAQRFERHTIARLCDALGDPRFGAVSGALQIGADGTAHSLAEHYWLLERWLRRNEAVVHSAIGVTGAVYAMRRECWRSLPAGVILDDLYGPMDLVLRGWRVGFVSEAVAIDERRFASSGEFRRKARTLTGVIQLCAWRPALLVPWRNPVWLQFVFHKLLRLVTPYLLLVGGVAGAAWLVQVAGIASPMAALATLAGAVALGTLLLAMSRRLRETIGMAMAMQGAVLRATVNGLRGRWDVWGR